MVTSFNVLIMIPVICLHDTGTMGNYGRPETLNPNVYALHEWMGPHWICINMEMRVSNYQNLGDNKGERMHETLEQ